MASLGTITLTGASGTTYTFNIYERSATFKALGAALPLLIVAAYGKYIIAMAKDAIHFALNQCCLFWRDCAICPDLYLQKRVSLSDAAAYVCYPGHLFHLQFSFFCVFTGNAQR